jgi:hypothetical protein
MFQTPRNTLRVAVEEAVRLFCNRMTYNGRGGPPRIAAR